MKILILCFNYPPDLGAGAFRMKALVDAFEEMGHHELELQIITTQPNRYAELKTESPNFEDLGWLKIHRIALPTHNSGMKDQAWSYQSYARGVFSLTRKNKYDLVFATSSRLMTAVLGWLIAKKTKSPLYLDIRDLFTDTMGDVLKGSKLRTLLPVFRWLEKRSFQAAEKINVVSEGFLPHLKSVAPHAVVSCFTNGIDEAFLNQDFSKQPLDCEPQARKNQKILYAGNIGDGQGLHRILPQAAEKLASRASFKVLGSGGKLSELTKEIKSRKLGKDAISLCPPVKRQELLFEYQQADILFLHLNDYPAFSKVLPSKIFEYAATGKPIIAGVSGYAKEFLTKHVPQAIVISPCDSDELVEAVEKLASKKLHIPKNEEFETKFARKAIMKAMSNDLLTVASSKNDNAIG